MGTYISTDHLVDNTTAEVADVKPLFDTLDATLAALDTNVEAIADATFIVNSASAALDAEITLATALASPPAIGGTAPAAITGTSVKARASSTNSVTLASNVATGDKGIQINFNNATDQGTIRAIHAGTAEKQLTLNEGGGATACGGSLTVVGALSKGSGSFLIDHPLDPDNRSLGHGFVEAPRYDLIYRGRVALVAGAAQVSIDDASNMTPGTWAALCRNAQVFVSNNEGWTPVRGRVDEATGTLAIEAQDASCTDTVDWLVVAERNDAWIYEDPFTDEDGHYVAEHDKPTDARADNPIILPERGKRRHPKAQARKLAAMRLSAKKVH